jgi:hypothetical protein
MMERASRLDIVFEAGSQDRDNQARVMSGTHMSIVSSCGEFPFHSLPFDAEHPALVAR